MKYVEVVADGETAPNDRSVMRVGLVSDTHGVFDEVKNVTNVTHATFGIKTGSGCGPRQRTSNPARRRRWQPRRASSHHPAHAAAHLHASSRSTRQRGRPANLHATGPTAAVHKRVACACEAHCGHASSCLHQCHHAHPGRNTRYCCLWTYPQAGAGQAPRRVVHQSRWYQACATLCHTASRVPTGAAGPARFKLPRTAAVLTLPPKTSIEAPTLSFVSLRPHAPPRVSKIHPG